MAAVDEGAGMSMTRRRASSRALQAGQKMRSSGSRVTTVSSKSLERPSTVVTESDKSGMSEEGGYNTRKSGRTPWQESCGPGCFCISYHFR